MRSNLLTLAALCLSLPALAADGGPDAGAIDAGSVDAGSLPSDAGPAMDLPHELNRSMGAARAAQTAIEDAATKLQAEHKLWVEAQEKVKPTDKKAAKVKASDLALITKHSVVQKKHAELVVNLEKLAKQHAEKKVDDKKARTSLEKLMKEEQRLSSESQLLIAEHVKLIGSVATDAGVADAGAALDAGSTDAGLDAGLVADAGPADSGLVQQATADAGVSEPKAKAKGCSAVDGAMAWSLLCALALLRRTRIRAR